MQRYPKDGGGDIEQPVGGHGEQPEGQQHQQQALVVGTELQGGRGGVRTGVSGVRSVRSLTFSCKGLILCPR